SVLVYASPEFVFPAEEQSVFERSFDGDGGNDVVWRSQVRILDANRRRQIDLCDAAPKRVRIRGVVDNDVILPRAVPPLQGLDHPVPQPIVVNSQAAANDSRTPRRISETDAWRGIVVII